MSGLRPTPPCFAFPCLLSVLCYLLSLVLASTNSDAAALGTKLTAAVLGTNAEAAVFSTAAAAEEEKGLQLG